MRYSVAWWAEAAVIGLSFLRFSKHASFIASVPWYGVKDGFHHREAGPGRRGGGRDRPLLPAAGAFPRSQAAWWHPPLWRAGGAAAQIHPRRPGRRFHLGGNPRTSGAGRRP